LPNCNQKQNFSDTRRYVPVALARQGRWVTVYYGWRPNLPDEGDNHLIELALAGAAQVIVTHNLRGMTPEQSLEDWK
jgi:predicted nucleic acid-binding protein